MIMYPQNGDIFRIVSGAFESSPSVITTRFPVGFSDNPVEKLLETSYTNLDILLSSKFYLIYRYQS